jgi:hypothetical protein
MNVARNVLVCCAVISAWALGPVAECAEIAQGKVHSVVELHFDGPDFGPADAPARDVDFWVLLRHESGSPEFKVHGYWDGDGQGGPRGGVFCVRFCPTQPGRWTLAEVTSNVDKLNGQKENDHVTVAASNHPGFWIVDEASNGRRWYKRSDGSHPYIIGNTHYSFLSGYMKGGLPTGREARKQGRTILQGRVRRRGTLGRR